MFDDTRHDRLGRTRQPQLGRLAPLASLIVLAGLSGCFGSGKQAGDQLRSALSYDRLPEQYEPAVDADPDFGEE